MTIHIYSDYSMSEKRLELRWAREFYLWAESTFIFPSSFPIFSPHPVTSRELFVCIDEVKGTNVVHSIYDAMS